MSGCHLYLITPPQLDLAVFPDQLRAALDAGPVPVLQLRLKEGEKTAPRETLLHAAEMLLPICEQVGTQLIINDSPELAVQTGAHGVHVGEEDVSVKQARAIVGEDRVVGASCYGSTHRAMEAAEQGADYVAFGAFYPTQTKKPKGRPTPDFLRDWVEQTTMPTVAIGGITPDNAAPLVEAGADFVAVVTGVWDDAQGPAMAVQAYYRVLEQHTK